MASVGSDVFYDILGCSEAFWEVLMSYDLF